MKYHRYLLTLVMVPVLLFTVKTYAKSQAEENYVTTEKPIRPFLVEVLEQDGTSTLSNGESRGANLADIVSDLDIINYPEDKLSIFPELYMEMGGKITLRRAPVINLKDGKKKFIYRSWANNVGELLAEKKIQLGADDKVVPPLSSPVTDSMEVKINRVAITTIIEKKEIDFKKLEKNDPELKYGKTRLEAGIKGEKQLTYLVTRIDGEEVSRVLQESKITAQPKDEIKYTGTKVIVLSSISGKATIGPSFCNIVSANYRKGTLVRITNLASRASFIDTVDCTWGTATAPDGIVLDLSRANLSRLKWNGSGAGPQVLVEEIER